MMIAGSAHADGLGTERIVGPPQAHAVAAKYLYINRCVGGCTIRKGGYPGDAGSRTSFIPDVPDGTDVTLNEYRWDRASWDALMLCLKEVYSPYDVTVSDMPPAPGTPYNEGIVAGTAAELHYSASGVAPVTSDCSPFSYVISFTLANSIGSNPIALCQVAAQETGHAFGLDHAFEYFDGRSACIDPMSYRGDCGGQRFFRNDAARCGEYSARPCSCGGLQNSHLKLLSVLGHGTPITAPPVISLTSPANGAQISNESFVNATASAQRGVKTVELWLNGYKWAEVPGARFGSAGQPESPYGIRLPASVPDGIIDVVVRAKDDIDVSTETEKVTVTKGAPCATADACAAGQRCDAGRCLWDAPVGVLGDSCEYKQFCKNELCAGADPADQRCTQVCVSGPADACPVGFECLETTAGGLCWPASAASPGGCSTSNDAAACSGLFLFGLAFVIRRRRRR